MSGADGRQDFRRLDHVVMFTGHMIDAPGRPSPRFPESCVPAARAAVRESLTALRPSLGIAAAASGGDLLFHEVCGELGIATEVRLALPPERFVEESVAKAGSAWVARFWRLIETKRAEGRLVQMSEPADRSATEASIWSRANLWMLEDALALGARRLSILALWNGQAGDGPGGTADLLERAQRAGATPVVIDTNSICQRL